MYSICDKVDVRSREREGESKRERERRLRWPMWSSHQCEQMVLLSRIFKTTTMIKTFALCYFERRKCVWNDQTHSVHFFLLFPLLPPTFFLCAGRTRHDKKKYCLYLDIQRMTRNKFSQRLCATFFSLCYSSWKWLIVWRLITKHLSKN